MRSLFREPLVHFILLGFLVFLYYKIQEPQNTSTIQKEQIHIQTQPSTKDDNITISIEFLDAVLLKEAISLDLHAQDKEIREKLLKKVHFILAQNNFNEPTEEALLSYYNSHKQNYAQKKAISFAVLTFDNKEKAYKVASYIDFLHVDIEKLPRYTHYSYEKTKQQFGLYVANTLFHQRNKSYSKVLHVQGKYIIIYLFDVVLGKQKPFDAVEFQVYDDLKNEREKQLKNQKIQKILKRYELVIDEN
jgi:hypothetical protein